MITAAQPPAIEVTPDENELFTSKKIESNAKIAEPWNGIS